MAVVGLSVAAIPEGLPAVLTITLAIGVQAMARRNAIVRRLPPSRLSARSRSFAADKTGTLTRNEMMVATIAAGRQIYAVDGSGYAPEGAIRVGETERSAETGHCPDRNSPGRDPAVTTPCCTRTRPAGVSRATRWRARYKPWRARPCVRTRRCSPTGLEPTASPSMPAIATWPFSTTITRAMPASASRARPERIIPMCTDQRAADGSVEPLDADYWHARIEDIASQGPARARPGDPGRASGSRGS